MNAAEVHAILIRRLDFLHETFMEASADLAAAQFERVGADCNHANWLVGHHLWEKDLLLARWPTGTSVLPQDLSALYGFGSQPAEAGGCPDIEELRALIADSHAPILERVKAEELTRPGVEAPEFFPTRLDTVLHFVHDGSYHLGQLSWVRKLVDAAKN